jgi:hypothetical protein
LGARRDRFEILRLLIILDGIQKSLLNHAMLYTERGATEFARDRLPVNFWSHIEELLHLAERVAALTQMMWEESGLDDERDRLTPLYRDVLIAVHGKDVANEILMDLARRRKA